MTENVNEPSAEAAETESTPIAAAVAQPAVAESSVPIAAPTAAPDKAAAEEAAENDWFSQQGERADSAASAVKKPEAQQAKRDSATAEQPATTPEPLDVPTLTVLKRAHVEIEDFQAMKPERQAKFLANLAKQQSFTDGLLAERQRYAAPQGQQPPAAQGQPPIGQPVQQDNDPLAKLEEEYGAEYVAPFRAKFQAQEAQINQSRTMNEQLMSRMAWEDFDKGLAESPLPAGIDGKSPEIRFAIMKQAAALAQVEGLSLPQAIAQGFLRHAVPQAAASLYHKQYTASLAEQQKQEQAKRLRGSPTRTSAHPKSRPEVPSSEEERERNWFDSHKELSLSA